MRVKRALVTVLTAGALALVTGPGAGAAGAAPASPAVSAPAPDGFLYAWEQPHAGGFHCRWTEDNANWAGCRNKVSDVWNNGFPGRGEDVRLFYGLEWTGSWVCLHRGDSFPDLVNDDVRFFSAGAGRGERVNDNVSSHDWVDRC
ncbi:peptidase inhibitor family I36 protein [Streptomyces sp. NPDC020807]|uniref:peptidase inhibitor family I36 protein n=1 Tax=Streptomyces sp. NPDC020807 TaxID=3155119 RepID=UPI0033D61C91